MPALIAPQSDGKQFQLPGYLVSDEERISYYDRDHAGTGLIWAGLGLITIPAITTNLSPISLGAWGVGLALALIGMARARIDRQALLRSGALAGVASVVIIGVMVNQIVRTDVPQTVEAPSVAESADSDEDKESALDADDSAPQQSFEGTVPAIRGSELHTGVYPGPGPEGDPFRLWRFDTGTSLRSPPVIGNQTAYFGTRDGYLVAVDLATGMQRWKKYLGGFPVSSAPALGERFVFVASGYKVFAFNAKSGDAEWEFNMSYAGEASPVYFDGVLYVASKETSLHALDASNGETVRSPYRGDDELFFGSPAVHEDIVVIGGDTGRIYAWERHTGIAKWRSPKQTGGGIYSSPVLDGGMVFVTDTSQTVQQVALSTGNTIWTYPVGGTASPAFDGETLIVASQDGGIYALDPASESPELWVYPTSGGTMQSPAIVNDTVYAVSGSTIYALSLEDGTQQWTYPLGSNATTEPVIVDGMIYIGAEDGNLYAIAGTGEPSGEAEETSSG